MRESIKNVYILVCVLIIVALSGYYLEVNKKIKEEKLENIYQNEINEKIETVLNITTCNDLYELFSIYYEQVRILEREYNPNSMPGDKNILLDNNLSYDEILSYMDRYNDIGQDFENSLNKLNLDDELKDVRYYFNKHIEYSMIALDYKLDMYETEDESLYIKIETSINNSEAYLNKALDILEKEVGVDVDDYSWSV